VKPATVEEIVGTFNCLDDVEILQHNWRTCGRDCFYNWDVNDETYINGVLMTLDFDYMMGYFIQAVDRTTSECRYIAVLQRHGRSKDGSIDHIYEVAPDGHTFFARDFDEVRICQWAVASIYRMRSEPYE
jgi:hypothetical protein